MANARFGPAGNEEAYTATKPKTYAQIVPYLQQKGLTCYEYQCGRGVRVNEQKAAELKEAASAAGIALSLHAPYYISLSGVEEETRLRSIDYILQSAQAAQAMGADRIIVHTGSAGKISRNEAMELAADTLQKALAALDENGFGHLTLCPETMGKVNQLGTLDEVIKLCTASEKLTPCLDFGHLYARSMGADCGTDFVNHAVDLMQESLGEERAHHFHVHFSKIAFTTPGGEKNHLTLADDTFGPDFLPFVQTLAKRGLSPRVICESAGTQAADAALLQTAYLQALED